MTVQAFELSVGLCPGQGGYRQGVLATLARHQPAAEALAAVDEASLEVLGRPLLATLAGHASRSDDELFEAEPELVQLAVFAASVGLGAVLRDAGVRVSVLIGHSLGELAALVCGGGLTVTDGARILGHRLLALREHDSSGGGMVALGAGPERTAQILDLLPTAGVVLAVDNGPRQTAVSGPVEGLRRVERIAEAIGVSATRLRASHPFHHVLLAPARRALAERVGGTLARSFHTPVFSPVLGRTYRAQDDLGELLASHLTTPVRFGPAVQRAPAAVWVELGAGRTLTGLVRAIRPDDTLLAPLAGTTTLPQVVTFLTGSPAGAVAALPEPRPEPVTVPVAVPVEVPAAPPEPAVVAVPLPREEIEARVRRLYATALEYPEEVFEPGAELEADLGVDSVKQTELMTRLGEEFALGPRPEDLRMGDYRTFGRLVDFVSDSLAGPAAVR
jgi:acyl transferase domain-containing protein/acyl carrier protein